MQSIESWFYTLPLLVRWLAFIAALPIGMVIFGACLCGGDANSVTKLEPGTSAIEIFFRLGAPGTVMLTMMFLPTFFFMRLGMDFSDAALPGVLVGCVLVGAIVLGIEAIPSKQDKEETTTFKMED